MQKRSTIYTSTPLTNKRLSQIINQSRIHQVETDDELERSRVCRKSDIQRRVSFVESPRSPQLTNEKEIQEHFEICMKLYAENKISKNNAWKLKMVDCMVKSQDVTRDSLHVASTSLDVSTKIYGIRVDSIHTDGLKLASNLARVNDQSESEVTGVTADDQNDKDWDMENEHPMKTYKRQKLIIAEHLDSLLKDVSKLPSVFFQTCANLEASPIENLLTTKLPMNHARYKFMLFSKEKAWASYDKKDPNINFDRSYPFKIPKVSNLQICAPFNDFEIDEWNPDMEAQLLSMEAHNSAIENQVVYDAEGIPIPELDGSIHDLFENAADVEQASSAKEEICRQSQARIRPNRIVNVIKFRPNETAGSAKFANKYIEQVWAGSSHWKLKNPLQAKKLFSGQIKKRTDKKVRKTQAKSLLINFHVDIPGFDISKTYKAKQCWIDISPIKCTLPQTTLVKSTLFKSLMLKPVFIKSQSKPHKESAEAVEILPCNYNNWNDSSLHGPHQEVNFLEDIDDEPAHGGDGNGGFQNEEEINETPNKNELITTTYAPYALHAKKIDMKKLKTAVWKSLVSNNPSEEISDESMYERQVHKKKFSDVYKEIPERLPEQMKQEINCPLAFVALLHLASKHNLNLIGQTDLSDFTVEKMEDVTFS